MRRRFPHLLAVLLVALTTVSFSISPAVSLSKPTTQSSLNYVQDNAVDYKSVLLPVPDKNSDETHIDIAQLLLLQQGRTPEDIARIKSELRRSPAYFTTVLPWLTADNAPLTFELLKHAQKDSAAIVDDAKEFYQRPRPPLIDPRIKPATDLPDTFSYPSSHSCDATVMALVLADLVPDQRDALLDRAHQIGDDRLLDGVHFPSDVEAGRVLATAIVKAMRQNPDFQADFAKAQAECKALEPVPAH